MNILIFEWKNFGVEDIEEALDHMGHTYTCLSSELVRERVSPEFDSMFEQTVSAFSFDCVFTFNYSPVVSNNCNRHHIPYIAFVYDSPLVSLYSYTIIQPCNYVFIFDKALYLDLKKENINTVYYLPLAVNTDRLERMLHNPSAKAATSGSHTPYGEIAFVGSMYNEKHNLFDRFHDLSEYTKGYLEGIMQAQLKVYGYYFIEDLLKDEVLANMLKSVPVTPNSDGVETVTYLYAYYFIARKLAAMERKEIMQKLSSQYDTRLYTHQKTPDLPHVHNMGPVDYYNDMPAVFKNSPINLNITLRSIRSGIPLRCMDIMGAGGFLMSNYQADFYDHFVPGEDLVLYESQEDLLSKCDYYLHHDAERRQIAANGLGKVIEAHTYEIRLAQIFDIVFN